MLTPNPYNSEEFRQAAHLMRRRQRDEFYRLDISGTVSATIAALGYPSFRYKLDSRPPEYLMLIERRSFRDHQAHLFNELAEALEQEGIFVERYFYDEDPRICRRVARDAYVHLSDLEHKYGGHRLLLLGSGEGLIDPVSGKLAAWTTLFSSWQARAILTPEPVTGWGPKETALGSGFQIFPATPAGLLALIGQFERAELGDFKSWQGKSADWPLPHGLDAKGATIVPALRAYLGAELFQWLCACAVYPELQWDLTLYLGSLISANENLITDENLMKLVSVPSTPCRRLNVAT